MLFRESETIELKEIVTDEIKKEIIAFANCNGGKLYIGVKDDGTVIGVDDADNVSLQISNMVRDTIKPDVTMFVHYETIEKEGKEIIAIDIQRGTDRPYYLAKKGMRPEGVYVRQGYSSVPATDNAIRRMIKETDGDRFEAMRSLNQNLTFEATKKEFDLRKIEFGSKQMQTLKLIDQDGLYTNLGLLLSDQCIHTIKVAVFQGTDQMVFKDRREFSGSLLKQMNEVYDFIDLHNQTRATIEKLLRIDVRDYPEVAVREALLNMLVHRDYSFSSSALISIYADRIEFVSIGGLISGIDLEDIMVGLSICRNQELANVFYRLHLIEAYGTGMRKIMKAYEGKEEKPKIETTKNAFKIILPNINAKYETGNITSSNIKATTNSVTGDKNILDDKERVLEYARVQGVLTRNDVMALLKVSASTATRILQRLVKENLLKQNGKARNTHYSIIKK
ncbi:RNA-binding domain-containing protein [Faecalitalea cylindroides]|uniref:RNA-binding domain-containing protein n=1 Tax=Faecalitalea cylindroides TaxID=39483 RepID=UPI00232E8CE9|nr:RNA-binding domain-containing protein [Faecalitalea cylindroides]MDB7951967.1 putative DNA binding domain-containing protein [Faecalitalea cylindroides]MDB7959703.1 putative DNA binding domain-containing protein [Faecalitalea cylindroides]MDB7961866.1 putative DNA binding domain-containing protein [Faecalitalea cylindroides]MDB7962747.1 putative DNA binding domain-containing protein [Faecalitalea cylindroides]MDB7964414.1 putative DNA binding domain-containing protein [Faecalitalea cylindro